MGRGTGRGKINVDISVLCIPLTGDEDQVYHASPKPGAVCGRGVLGEKLRTSPPSSGEVGTTQSRGRGRGIRTTQVSYVGTVILFL